MFYKIGPWADYTPLEFLSRQRTWNLPLQKFGQMLNLLTFLSEKCRDTIIITFYNYTAKASLAFVPSFSFAFNLKGKGRLLRKNTSSTTNGDEVRQPLMVPKRNLTLQPNTYNPAVSD